MADEAGFSRELDLRDYLQVLRRRRGTIAFTVVLVVGAALAFSLIQSRTYEATTQLLIDLPGGAGGADTTGARATEIVLMQAPGVRAAVAKKLGHPTDVSVRPVESTDVFAITARSTNARRAAQDADGYATVYIDMHREQTTAEALDLRRQIAEFDARLAVLDGELAAAGPLDRSSVTAQQATERSRIAAERTTFAGQLEALQPASNAESAVLVARAAVPSSPVKPDTRRNLLIALVVGLVLGVGAAFVREHFDDTVLTKDDVERVTGLPVVGMIPLDKGRKARNEPTLASPSSRAAEAYRTLRTSLQFMTVSRPIRSLQVTSPSAVDGKTTTVANLAVALARSGRRVVVACCDLRRPRVHDLLGLTNDVGLTSVLLGEVSLDEAVQPVDTEPDLFVLCAGPPPSNPAELLALPETTETLHALRDRYDMLIVDSPPVLPVTDALIVSGAVDATMIVATVGTTKKRGLERTVELLRQVGAPLVGAVLNNAGPRTGYGYGSGYGDGYGPQTVSDNGEGDRRTRTAEPAAD